MYLSLLFLLKKRGIPVLFLCINVFEHEDNFLKKLLTKLVLRRADAVIVHSALEKKEVLEINPNACAKIHPLPLFQYDGFTAEKRDNNLHLLFFGFVRQYKGLDVLLNAIGILRDPRISLKIAGEFWDCRHEYEKLIENLGISGSVEIIDRYIPDSEISEYFCWADVVALPYRKTKTSGIIATAYGYKKPVLATNVGGFDEVVRDGYTGKLVPPDDARSFAEGIAWFLSNNNIDFAANISEFSSRNMSWNSLVDMIETFNPDLQ